jgi:hypothetical protein
MPSRGRAGRPRAARWKVRTAAVVVAVAAVVTALTVVLLSPSASVPETRPATDAGRIRTPDLVATPRSPAARFAARRSPSTRRTRVVVSRGEVRVTWVPDRRASIVVRATQAALASRGEPPRLDTWPFAPGTALRRPGRRDRLPRRFRAGPCATACRPAIARRGWPLAPFDRQHPLRAGLNERRPSGFHIGVDIQARDRARVYALTSGIAEVPQASGVDERVRVGRLEYWHIDRRVSSGDRVIAYRTVLGTVKRTAGHLHLSDVGADGTYLDPLRPGGRVLAPIADAERPAIAAPVVRGGRLLVDAFDPQSFVRRTTYKTPVLAPAGLAWAPRARRGRSGPLRWVLRGRWLGGPILVGAVFGPGAGTPGWSCFRFRIVCVPTWRYLLASPAPPRGARITVYAWDWAGNATARDATVGVTPRRSARGS